jgi:hypothetical protein
MSKSKMKLTNQKEITVPSYIKYKSDAIQIYYRRTKSTKGYWLKYSRNKSLKYVLNLTSFGLNKDKCIIDICMDILTDHCARYTGTCNGLKDNVAVGEINGINLSEKELNDFYLDTIITNSRIMEVIIKGKIVDPLTSSDCKE